jgi:dienelactone hydrolase
MGLLVVFAFVFSAAGASATPIDKVSQRPDGSSIYWTIDRQSGGAKQGILLVAQGSGCLAATENPNITNAKRLLPAFAVVTVEKYGVEPHAKPADPFEGCSAVFYAHHTVSQRVTDYERVLDELKREPWWNGQLVLFGGSEGGGTVSILAAKVNPTAVVIFSAAPGHWFGEIFKLSVPSAVAQHAEDEFKKIEAEPGSAKVWGGNSYRWWADILRQDMTADLLKAESPILLVQGERYSCARNGRSADKRRFSACRTPQSYLLGVCSVRSRHAGRARSFPSRPSNGPNFRLDRGQAGEESERQVTIEATRNSVR